MKNKITELAPTLALATTTGTFPLAVKVPEQKRGTPEDIATELLN